ncbi:MULTISPECIES: TetR/AcrR family transcriptional regulator [unclassified Paenibacillus]|uniref:TetR/AcrR family transcriptional regulator n=1 Tax=unclassified Paenibacillus TaxID=185978 RepID=UPI000CFBAAAC|nr:MULTISPECIES: TetR/AcrR family transcriptional regulator [unclassified Paenibacillus]PRA08788.1 TetR family transcriptional regulator [Paenibacillus sp. MYb63]PRA48722.1 TetR family transcriptional regulator [Paenibacillus sp. MYb67]QZN73060.1 TetR/AcrR family transcriptional regulator [Paenibacillus sp. DR312]
MSSKKEMLLNVAEELFYLHGFHSIGLKRIITDAGIAIMTLYNHFESKDDLIVQVLLRREQRYLEQLRQYANNKEQPMFLNLAEGHVTWLKEHESRGCLFLRAKEEFGGHTDHIIVQTVNAHKRHMRTLIQTLAPAASDRDLLRFSLLLEGSTALAETENVNEVCRELIHMTQTSFK